jgi:NAD-dependent dihydropyrimidine dehydrogenase PreA subunit
MLERAIVEIDEELCNGCGQCIPNCAEGALQIIDGKAKIVKDEYCDGLGACLGHCPQDALRIIKREADPFDEEAVHEYLAGKKASEVSESSIEEIHLEESSQLQQWPVQLNLVPTKAGFFDDKELLVLADCVPVAYPKVHKDFLKGRSVVIGCPKLDDAQLYVEKLSQIIQKNRLKSIKIVHMEVPCCSGLNYIVGKSVELSGKTIPVERQVISIKGEVI